MSPCMSCCAAAECLWINKDGFFFSVKEAKRLHSSLWPTRIVLEHRTLALFLHSLGWLWGELLNAVPEPGSGASSVLTIWGISLQTGQSSVGEAGAPLAQLSVCH